MGFDPYSDDERFDVGQYTGDVHVAPQFRQTVDWQADCLLGTLRALAGASTGKSKPPMYIDSDGLYHVSKYAKPFIRQMFEILYLTYHVNHTESFLGEPVASVTLEQLAQDVSPWAEAWGEQGGDVKASTIGKVDIDGMCKRLGDFERYRKGTLGRPSLYRVTRDKDGGEVLAAVEGMEIEAASDYYCMIRDKWRASLAEAKHDTARHGMRGRASGGLADTGTCDKSNQNEAASDPNETTSNPNEAASNPNETTNNPNERTSNPNEATSYERYAAAGQGVKTDIGGTGARSGTVSLFGTVIPVTTERAGALLDSEDGLSDPIGDSGESEKGEVTVLTVRELCDRLGRLGEDEYREEVARIASTPGTLKVNVDYLGGSGIVADVWAARREAGLRDVSIHCTLTGKNAAKEYMNFVNKVDGRLSDIVAGRQ